MGHSRLGTLPDTSRWRKLVAAIAGGANVAAVADATMHAAKTGLELADGDEGFKQTFYLLSQVALASREENFSAALNDAGIKVGPAASVLALVGSFTSAIDDHLRETRSRTDVGEMTQLAAAETLTSLLRDRSKTLFGTTEADIKHAIRSYSTNTGYSTQTNVMVLHCRANASPRRASETRREFRGDSAKETARREHCREVCEGSRPQ